jgi:DNA polymerase
VGQAGQLLDRLLAGIELTRDDVYVVNVLKCRPPGNRDPQPEEIAACEPYLFRQVELVRPVVVATLGNFATKLLSGRQHGITRVRGQPQEVSIGGSRVTLYPLFHPAAALYTPSMLAVLEQDFARLPELLVPEGDADPVPIRALPSAPLDAVDAERMALEASGVQLGLF